MFCAYAPEQNSQSTQNLEGSIRATCRSKEAKIVQIGNPRWWPPWKFFWASYPEPKGQLTFNEYSFYTPGPTDSKLGRKYQGNIDKKKAEIAPIRNQKMATMDKKKAEIVPVGNPRWPLWPQSRHLFWSSSPEQKGQLTRNFVENIGLTCRSKIAEIILIGNPRCPPQSPSLKTILNFFWMERPRKD